MKTILFHHIPYPVLSGTDIAAKDCRLSNRKLLTR